MAIKGQYAYTTGDGHLQVIDISDPASPKKVGELETGPVDQLVVANDRVYLTKTRGEGIRAVDVRSPSPPKWIGSLNLSATEVAVGSEYMYAGGDWAGRAGLYVIAPNKLR